MTQTDPLSAPSATLSPNLRKARYGVSYLRTICHQAGVGITETSPDEDVLAIDCDIQFREQAVRVQVKCTSDRKLVGGTTTSWPIEDQWRAKWAAARTPVYLVIVIVPTDPSNWVEHDPQFTRHNTGAFWCRVRPHSLGKTISVPKSQRLTAQTIETWHEDLLAGFLPQATVTS